MLPLFVLVGNTISCCAGWFEQGRECLWLDFNELSIAQEAECSDIQLMRKKVQPKSPR